MKESLLNTPKLGFGCMRLPLLDEKDPTSIDIEHFKTMVDAFIREAELFQHCVRLPQRHLGNGLARGLVKRYPRDAYTVATKCLAWAAPDAATAQSNLQTSLTGWARLRRFLPAAQRRRAPHGKIRRIRHVGSRPRNERPGQNPQCGLFHP